MKPEGALTPSTACDLSWCSFEDALVTLGCFPICTLRVSKFDVEIAQRIAGLELPKENIEAVVSPRVNIVLDESYQAYEWSVEYDGKIFWSSGA